MNAPGAAKPLSLAAVLFSAVAAAQPPDTGSRTIEERQLARLARVERSGGALQPFTSDGCSGGLSEGWDWLARHNPRYAELFGRRPPWEACCVIHDWAYWNGGSADGYDRRLAADTALHQCVTATGARRADDIGARLHLPAARVTQSFVTAADLMFVAVRTGGAPCTPLPWRWGYGLAPCPALTTP